MLINIIPRKIGASSLWLLAKTVYFSVIPYPTSSKGKPDNDKNRSLDLSFPTWIGNPYNKTRFLRYGKIVKKIRD